MATERYTITQPQIETLLAWIKSGEIAIPEIQRPFVWDATKVRNFLDSLYQGFPVGFLITWRNPDIKLKDGTSSFGKRILIDGQQRMTALMAALLGQRVVTKDYKKVRIRIAFHPVRQQFEVYNSAIAKDNSWIPDIAVVFDTNQSFIRLVQDYCEKNPETKEAQISNSFERLKRITSNQIGVIELNHDLDIQTVTEIFIRVNSAGVSLNQADFAMSKIAVDEEHGGNILRKAIDYFCHLAIAPEFFETLRNDTTFAETRFFSQMSWLRNENDDLYDPSYTDMLRVTFATEFQRGRLDELVALLSGRNFETRQYEESIIEDSFNRLKLGVEQFINETHFKRFSMIIRSSGFIDSSLIGSKNALNFAYILYLTLRKQEHAPADIERLVRRWFVMSILRGRYSSSPETVIDTDIREIYAQGINAYARAVLESELSDSYWSTVLPQQLIVSISTSPAFGTFLAAQVKLGDKGFLSRDITIRELITYKSDRHHIFPRNFLKKHGMARGEYNQVANYVITQSEVNIAISDKEPRVYFDQLHEQVNGGTRRYGNITDIDELRENYRMNCIPTDMRNLIVSDYQDFLAERRKLMANKIRDYFATL